MQKCRTLLSSGAEIWLPNLAKAQILAAFDAGPVPLAQIGSVDSVFLLVQAEIPLQRFIH